MSPIFKANYSYLGELQTAWGGKSYACNRPAADFAIPIVCYTQKSQAGVNGYIVSPGWDLDAFERCCPFNDTGTNVYTTQRGCGRSVCFTYSEAVAEKWDGCIRETAAQKIDELNRESKNAGNFTKGHVNGRCEWVDYEMLKKGIQSSYNSSGALEAVGMSRRWGL